MPGRFPSARPPLRLSGLQLLDREALAAKFRCGLKKTYDLTKRPGFPSATYAFGDARWLEDEVDAYIVQAVKAEREVSASSLAGSADAAAFAEAKRLAALVSGGRAA